ncbi:E3 ubiquitin-protein ligase TRIM7-like [Accipiter gentilis]|uniref:E3 ubiquitin-protein ligase TRIM7-like n=1 Tax=Astur gentilis TaxID=8957 RepID=UPI00210F4030|nr:E3 ubiquitin-protein ligase TRIM7-like [Accipiter gentilis]
MIPVAPNYCRRRIGAEFARLHRFLAEKEHAVLGRLAELDAAFEAAQAEKSLRVAEGITRLHGLIGQLEVKRTPQAIRSILSSWSEMRLRLPSELPAELEKSLSSCRRQRDALWQALKEFRETGQPETKPGRGRCPSAEEKAKPPREPGAVPLPQLLADRKSVRWDEEERDEAEEPRRAQGPAGGSERVGHPGEMQDTDVLAGFCQRLLFPPDTGVLPAPPNTSSLPPEFLSQLRSCRRSCKSLRSAPNLPSPTLPLPLATALGVLECCRSPLR